MSTPPESSGKAPKPPRPIIHLLVAKPRSTTNKLAQDFYCACRASGESTMMSISRQVLGGVGLYYAWDTVKNINSILHPDPADRRGVELTSNSSVLVPAVIIYNLMVVSKWIIGVAAVDYAYRLMKGIAF